MRNTNSREETLKAVRKSVYKQALLAGLIILLTVILLFAMTTAWYTNIAQTSGLMFEAAAWGFSGEIEVSEQPIQAAPGDDGNVYLTLENDSESLVDVSVYVDKTQMGADMQKRLYFYVDASTVSNGETVDRVYLSKGSGYDYTVMGLGNLTLTESYHNDAQIKWEWVYDVLGYYVLGSLQVQGEYTTLAEAYPNSTVTVQEYLRPVEYHYDDTLTTFETDKDNLYGDVATIDGVTTVAEFLAQITANDGYAGTVDARIRTSDGYWPVAVDSTGYGVWLYLCDYSEIEQAIIWDTAQGTAAATNENPATFKAILNISAQKSDVETTVVSTTAQLLQALQSTDGSTNSMVQLASNITLDYAEIPSGKKLVLDLNGYTVSSTTDAAAMISAGEGSALTVLNGKVQGTGGESVAINATGAEVTLSGVTASNVGRLVEVTDQDGSGTDSKVRILNCTVNSTDCVVYVAGNGAKSDGATQVVVEQSTIYGDYAGILCNGSSNNCGTDISVIDSDVSGYWTGIYHPQKDSTLTISGSTISGYTGLALKGGYITIRKSVITGTGARQNPIYGGSGWSDTGDGVYVEANYDWNTVVEIHDSTVTSTYGYAVQKFMPDAANASITVYSGTFSTDVTNFIPSDRVISPVAGENGQTWYEVTPGDDAEVEIEVGG